MADISAVDSIWSSEELAKEYIRKVKPRYLGLVQFFVVPTPMDEPEGFDYEKVIK